MTGSRHQSISPSFVVRAVRFCGAEVTCSPLFICSEAPFWSVSKTCSAKSSPLLIPATASESLPLLPLPSIAPNHPPGVEGFSPYQISIGIEHEGYVSDPNWLTNTRYRSSARLSAYLCRKYRIPVDRRHIIGHNEVPGCSGAGGGVGCHTDPGRYWNWAKYMRLVRAYH